MNSTTKEITLIIIGSLFFALGVNLFAIPNELGEGGVTGISMTLYYVFDWSPGITNFVMNGVLLAIGYKVLNKRVTWYTMLAIFFTSLFIQLTEGMGDSVDIMLGTVFAGVFIGLGLGLVLRSGGTTGGSTIVARMLNQQFGWGVSTSMFVFDILVVLSSIVRHRNREYDVHRDFHLYQYEDPRLPDRRVRYTEGRYHHFPGYRCHREKSERRNGPRSHSSLTQEDIIRKNQRTFCMW